MNGTPTPITWLRFVRIREGYTLDRLADEAGVSKVQLSRYENGHRTPTLATAHKIADVLGVAPDLIFPRDGRWTPMQVLDHWLKRAEQRAEENRAPATVRIPAVEPGSKPPRRRKKTRKATA